MPKTGLKPKKELSALAFLSLKVFFTEEYRVPDRATHSQKLAYNQGIRSCIYLTSIDLFVSFFARVYISKSSSLNCLEILTEHHWLRTQKIHFCFTFLRYPPPRFLASVSNNKLLTIVFHLLVFLTKMYRVPN